MFSRMMVYELYDAKYDPNVRDATQNQPHRKPDFSHIPFHDDKGDKFTVDELVDEVCEKLGSSLETFRNLNQSKV